MSAQPPAATTFCFLVLSSSFLHTVLLAALLDQKPGISAHIDGSYERPSADTLRQLDMPKMCYNLLVDEAISHITDWDDLSAINRDDALSQHGNTVRGQLNFGPFRSFFHKGSIRDDENSPPSRYNPADFLNFITNSDDVQTRGDSGNLLGHSASQFPPKREDAKLSRHCLDLVLRQVYDSLSVQPSLNSDVNEAGNILASRATMSDIGPSEGRGKPTKFALFDDGSHVQPSMTGLVSSGSPNLSKRGLSNWVQMARRAVKRRRHHLSINNALMTLTDMILEESVQRVLRNRANMRKHMLIQG